MNRVGPAPKRELGYTDSGASGFMTFNDAPVSQGGSGKVLWARLKFHTRERKSASACGGASPNCCVCMEEQYEAGSRSPVPSSCGHSFHTACLSEWQEEAHTLHQHDDSCPVCRETIEM